VVLLLAALSLSALTTLLAAALSGLLLLLAWLLLAAAALLLARLVLTALLAGILLVRIVHNFSYFDSSPVMTTILTPLGCSRFELNLRLLRSFLVFDCEMCRRPNRFIRPVDQFPHRIGGKPTAQFQLSR
jgi:hypothetical protein